jgi:uncharacterized integral membrane protein
MPRRLIQIIVFFAVILLFIVFNLENKCDISIIIKKIPDVPVYLIAFFSFILGMISTLPFIFSYQLRKKRKTEDEKRGPAASADLPNSSHYGID